MKKISFGFILLSTVALLSASTTALILPTGSGTYSSWTPSTGVTHYTLVDESSCNGATDYVSTNTLNNRDSYSISLSSIPDGSKITGVSVTPCASRDTNKSSTMAAFYRLNGVDSANGSAYTLSGTIPADLTATSYSGLSVTKTSTTTLESGVILLSGTGGARVSRVATVVTYITNPGAPVGVTNTVSTTTPKKVNMSWSNQADTTGINIERSIDNVNFSLLFSTSTAITSYGDATVTTGTYYYRLQAFNVVGSSPYSSTTVAVVP